MKRKIFAICIMLVGILTACGSSEESSEIQNQETEQESGEDGRAGGWDRRTERYRGSR